MTETAGAEGSFLASLLHQNHKASGVLFDLPKAGAAFCKLPCFSCLAALSLPAALAACLLQGFVCVSC